MPYRGVIVPVNLRVDVQVNRYDPNVISIVAIDVDKENERIALWDKFFTAWLGAGYTIKGDYPN